MAIIKSVWKASLGPENLGGDSALELSVVREDRKTEILFSVVEGKGKVKRRLTFTLSAGKAHDLARFLAGISELARSDEAAERADDELTPTKPGPPADL